MEESIVKNIVNSLVKLYGKEKIKALVEESEDSEPVRPLGNTPGCPKGQIWNPLVGRCVDDIG